MKNANFEGSIYRNVKIRIRLTRNRDNRATPDAKTEERNDFHRRGDSEQGNGVESEQYIFGGIEQ